MAKKDLPAPQELCKLLRYEPETGKLYWRKRPVEMFSRESVHRSWNSRWAGKEAFTTADSKGYLCGKVKYDTFKAHRIAWVIYYGTAPIGEIDHINGVKHDNQINNLRDTTGSQNCRNITRLRSNNTSGVVGVIREMRKSGTHRWVARITYGGKQRTIGRFSNFEDAVKARKEAEIAHGYI